jgi:hypothetical protein
MSIQSLAYDLPIWLFGLILIIVLALSLEVGYRLGYRQRDRWKDAETGGGALVLTSMFAVMGLILAFSYAAGMSRNEKRKQNVIAEANALGTAFLRSNLVDEPGRTALKRALLEYAHTRVFETGVVLTSEDEQRLIQVSKQKLARLWPVAEKAVNRRDPPGPIEVSLVAAINDTIDIHTTRVAGAVDKLPRAVFWMLILITAASLAIAGFNAGISGQMSRWRMTTFVVILAGVLLVIIDFDRAGDGLIRVSQATVYNVIEEMEADLPK